MDVKMDKEPDSMVKAEYAASEIYSTASEAPPVSDFLYPLLIIRFETFRQYEITFLRIKNL